MQDTSVCHGLAAGSSPGPARRGFGRHFGRAASGTPGRLSRGTYLASSGLQPSELSSFEMIEWWLRCSVDLCGLCGLCRILGVTREDVGDLGALGAR